MNYVTQSELEAELPPQHLIDACDDDGDGVADEGRIESVLAGASRAVDGYLEGRYSVPLAEPPQLARRAALVFALETIYRRRNSEKNPWSEEAGKLRARLEKVASGEQPLTLIITTPASDGAVIGEPMRATGGRVL